VCIDVRSKIMTDSISNCSSVDSISCHRFPELTSDTSCSPPSAGSDGCSFFKPLYKTSHEDLQTKHCNEAQDRADQVRQIRFQDGFEAGRQEACLLAKEQMVPVVAEFVEEYVHFNQYADQLQAHSCNQICAMAVRFSEKILGRSPCLTMEDLTMFEAELKRQMAGFYQLKLCLNPDDRRQLLQLTTEQNPHWKPSTSMIAIDADVRVDAGALITQKASEPFPLNDSLAELLNQILAEASTK
jgi:hypothetical protein